jgi:hypothetical protein
LRAAKISGATALVPLVFGDFTQLPQARSYLRLTMFRSIPLFAAAFALAGDCVAQQTLRDTSIVVIPISLSYAYQLPQGDMALRYGANSNIGLSAGVKLKSNYYLGAEGSFIFGNKINDQSFLEEMVSDNGVIVDQDGAPATVLLYERGYTAMLTVGKVMPIVGPNPNSGILLKLGGGYIRHKIRIETQQNVVPALEGEYAKLYDQLAAGPAGMLFIGYQHFGNRRLINFMFGFEVLIASTEPLRAYDMTTGRANSGRRADGLYGLRFGWTLPIHKNADDRIYYH